MTVLIALNSEHLSVKILNIAYLIIMQTIRQSSLRKEPTMTGDNQIVDKPTGEKNETNPAVP